MHLPLPTPTFLGTVDPPARVPLTTTPRPDTCIFRTSPTEAIGVYRFNWDNATFTLDTQWGPLIVDGPRTLTPGPRQLILLHNGDLATAPGVALNFEVGGTLIYDLAHGVQEVRDAGGSVVTQSQVDPLGDTKGLPPYLDLIRIERTFGYYPNSIVRVYLAGVHTGPFIWTFQNVAVSVGDATYTQQRFFDGRVKLTASDAQGRLRDWPGPVTVEANVVAFALQTGVDQAMQATTLTSGGGGDLAGPYPVSEMQQVWEATRTFCP